MVYLKDDKATCFGQDNTIHHLYCLKLTGAITEEEYRFQYQALQQELLARQSMMLQLFTNYQDQQYKQQSLDYQRQSLYQQRRSADALNHSPYTVIPSE